MKASPSWPLRQAKEARLFIDLLQWEGLRILPYIRRRLVFAQLAAAALEQGEVDSLAVDLPHFLNRSEILEASHTYFPRVLSLIVQSDPQRHLVLPLVPNDAAYLATYVARRKPIAYECVDDERLLFYPERMLFAPDLPLRDDYLALTDGLESYFAPLWTQLDGCWKALSPIQKTYTEVRAAVVADRLRQALSPGRRILFVCEYRLWWAVKRALEANPAPPLVSIPDPVGELDGVLVAEDPRLLWAMGFLDDFPRVNLKFYRAVKEGNPLSFDKVAALSSVLLEFIRRGDLIAVSKASLRRFLVFHRYLRSRLLACGRVVPLPARHLLEGAKSCYGKEFARELATTLLEYPDGRDDAQQKAHGFFRLRSDGTLERGAPFEIPDILVAADYFGDQLCAPALLPGESERGAREEWAHLVRQRLTRTEARQLEGSERGIRWAVKADYLLHQTVCALVKEAVTREARRTRTQRSWGSMGDGVHWKATIAAKARRERAIYIKRHRKDLRLASIDEHTPCVFLLSPDLEGCASSVIHDANLAQRNINLGNAAFPVDQHPAPDLVYSVFKIARTMDLCLDGHVQREWNAALAFLYTRSHMGVERYTAITKRPRRYQCRVQPGADPELRDFPPPEQIVAWAIKYAERFIIVVAHQGWTLSPRLRRFAYGKNVKTISVPLSILPPSLIRRLQTGYMISTPLKKHPRREQILRRLVG